MWWEIRCCPAAKASISGSTPRPSLSRRTSLPGISHAPIREFGRTRPENLDFSLFKNFSLTERFKLQFRAEAFNLTNTPVFSAPGTTVNGVNFGVITGQSNVPRNLQLALKILF